MRLFFLVLLFCGLHLKSAEDVPADENPLPETATEDRSVRTRHSMQVGGERMEYEVQAGTLPLRDDKDKVTASIFYIAYTRVGTEVGQRPVTFSFNGGPGSSSVWLHMGLLGPKRVLLQESGFALPPPHQLVENEFTLLDETDLVFIDPISTGYSRAVEPDQAEQFHGVKQDVRSVAEFIRLYVTRNQRWLSPKFLIGESYGTTRAAALSGELLNQHRLSLNGIMLVSNVLNFQTLWDQNGGNDLPYVLFFPSYTAAAWYHRKLAPELQARPLHDVLKEAEALAVNKLQHALLLGASIDDTEKTKIAAQMSRLAGVSKEFILGCDLRIPSSRFNAELLRDQKMVIGRFDCRYTAYVQDPLSSYAETDPSADAVFSAFASTFNHYVRSELGFEEDKPYQILTGLPGWNWDAKNQFLNVSQALAEVMTANPFLKIHVSNGLYDMATPYFASRYTMWHLRVHPELRKNIIEDDYTAGHMMYLNLPDLQKQKQDLARFIRTATGAQR